MYGFEKNEFFFCWDWCSVISWLVTLKMVLCIFHPLWGFCWVTNWEDEISVIAYLSFLPLVSAFYVLGVLFFHQRHTYIRACLSFGWIAPYHDHIAYNVYLMKCIIFPAMFVLLRLLADIVGACFSHDFSWHIFALFLRIDMCPFISASMHGHVLTCFMY